MYDVIALGELLIDFAAKETDADGYPTMKANTLILRRKNEIKLRIRN